MVLCVGGVALAAGKAGCGDLGCGWFFEVELIPLIAVMLHFHLFVVLQRDKVLDDHVVGGESLLCAYKDFNGTIGLFDLVEAVGIDIPEHIFFFVEADGLFKGFFHFFGFVALHVADREHGLGDPVPLKRALKVRHGFFEVVFHTKEDDADLCVNLSVKKELPTRKAVSCFEFFDRLIDDQIASVGVAGDLGPTLKGFKGLNSVAKEGFGLFGGAAHKIEVRRNKPDQSGRECLPPHVEPEIKRDKKKDARNKRED